jgi:hypothetical protein
MKLWNQIKNAWVEPEPWQLGLKVGDYYAIYPNRLVVGPQALPAPTVYGRIQSDENCEAGFFIVLGYSEWMPQGEVGEFCICEATHILTEEQFRQAQQAGWPELPAILEEE